MIDEYQVKSLDISKRTKRNRLIKFEAHTYSAKIAGLKASEVIDVLSKSKDGVRLDFKRKDDVGNKDSLPKDQSRDGDVEDRDSRLCIERDDQEDQLNNLKNRSHQYLRKMRIESVFLALGFLKLEKKEGGNGKNDEINAPLLLVPVSLKENLNSGSRFSIKSRGDSLVVDNGVLHKEMERLKINLPKIKKCRIDTKDWVEEYLQDVREAISRSTNWKGVVDENICYVSCFVDDKFQEKMDGFRDKILDTSKKNRLIKFEARTYSAKIAGSTMSEVVDILFKDEVHLDFEGKGDIENQDQGSRLYIERYEKGNPLENLKKKSHEYLRETGIDSVFLALGSLKIEQNGGDNGKNDEMNAPLLLMPVSLKKNLNSISPFPSKSR